MKATVTENANCTLRLPVEHCRRVAKFCCDLAVNVDSEADRLRGAASVFLKAADGLNHPGRLCNVEAKLSSLIWLYGRMFKTAGSDMLLNQVCHEISVQMARYA